MIHQANHLTEMSTSGASVTNSDDEDVDESNMMVESRQKSQCLLPHPPKIFVLKCPKDSQAPNDLMYPNNYNIKSDYDIL